MREFLRNALVVFGYSGMLLITYAAVVWATLFTLDFMPEAWGRATNFTDTIDVLFGLAALAVASGLYVTVLLTAYSVTRGAVYAIVDME